MKTEELKVTYLGGPTIIIEIEGLRFMTDPTLDEGGNTYQMTPEIVLEKTDSPTTQGIPTIDYVLLSHEHHQDNIDTKGRALLNDVKKVFTSEQAAAVINGNSVGIPIWESETIITPNHTEITITATPARHGPAGTEKMIGPVIGFVVSVKKENKTYELYITGDTVFYEGVQEVAKRFNPSYVFAFAGSVKAMGLFYITMNESDLINCADAFPNATIVPIHYEGWTHYSGTIHPAVQAFEVLGIQDRLHILDSDQINTLPL